MIEKHNQLSLLKKDNQVNFSASDKMTPCSLESYFFHSSLRGCILYLFRIYSLFMDQIIFCSLKSRIKENYETRSHTHTEQ